MSTRAPGSVPSSVHRGVHRGVHSGVACSTEDGVAHVRLDRPEKRVAAALGPRQR